MNFSLARVAGKAVPPPKEEEQGEEQEQEEEVEEEKEKVTIKKKVSSGSFDFCCQETEQTFYIAVTRST